MQIGDLMRTKARSIKIWLKCPQCGKERWVFRLRTKNKNFTGLCKACNIIKLSKALVLANKNRPSKPHRMKGVVFIKLEPDHPFYCMADILRHRVKRSRLVVAEYLGRPLCKNEEVHHINLNHCDDRLENLALFFCKASHSRCHMKYTKR